MSDFEKYSENGNPWCQQCLEEDCVSEEGCDMVDIYLTVKKNAAALSKEAKEIKRIYDRKRPGVFATSVLFILGKI